MSTPVSIGSIISTAVSPSVPVGSAVAAGSLVVMCVYDGAFPTTPGAVTDTQGNAYQNVVSDNINTATGALILGTVVNPLSTSDSITYTGSSTATKVISIAAMGDYNTLDSGYSASVASTGASIALSPSNPPVVSNELVFAYGQASSGHMVTSAAGWTLINGTVPASDYNFVWQINPTSNALPYDATISASSYYVGLIMSVYQTTPPPPPSNPSIVTFTSVPIPIRGKWA